MPTHPQQMVMAICFSHSFWQFVSLSKCLSGLWPNLLATFELSSEPSTCGQTTGINTTTSCCIVNGFGYRLIAIIHNPEAI